MHCLKKHYYASYLSKETACAAVILCRRAYGDYSSKDTSSDSGFDWQQRPELLSSGLVCLVLLSGDIWSPVAFCFAQTIAVQPQELSAMSFAFMTDRREHSGRSHRLWICYCIIVLKGGGGKNNRINNKSETCSWTFCIRSFIMGTWGSCGYSFIALCNRGAALP